MMNCFHCGARSPLEFVRDENDLVVLNNHGSPIMEWRGWGWKPNGR